MEFNLVIQKEPEFLLDRVCLLARDKVQVSGDIRRGSFSGLFDGAYMVDGEKVNVFIRRKPFFVSWDMVQKGLDYLVA